MWLAIQDRYWTSERLHSHGQKSNSSCVLCNQHPETVDHILVACIVSRDIWFKCLRVSGWQHLSSTAANDLVGWWLRSRKLVEKAKCRAFDSMCVLIARCIWPHRNDVVFRSLVSVPGLLAAIASQFEQWWPLRMGGGPRNRQIYS
jgi:hypothetical protein